MSTESPHLSVEQLAKRWHTTPKGIYNLKHRGKTPDAIKRGRKLLFPLHEVEAHEAADLDAYRKTRAALMAPPEPVRRHAPKRIPAAA